jgi:hypothetical protein
MGYTLGKYFKNLLSHHKRTERGELLSNDV